MAKGQIAQYGAIDVVKFLCAILIVVAHYISENAEGRVNVLVDYGSSLYVIVVPFFFACSGYFLFSKTLYMEENKSKQTIKNYIKRIFLMYVGWSAIYVMFKVAMWIKFGVSLDEFLHDLLNALTYSTYQTIWFLPALIIGVLITDCIYRKYGIKILFCMAILFYLIGALGVSYSFLLKETKGAIILSAYDWTFVSTRNGFFNGFPFVVVGLLVAKKRRQEFRSRLNYGVFTVLFGILFLAEAVFLKFKFDAVNVNTLIFLFPFTYYFLELCLGIPMQSGLICKWMRKMSTVIFLSQRLFLTAIPGLFPNGYISRLLKGNPYVGVVMILIFVIISSELIIVLGKRNRLINLIS